MTVRERTSAKSSAMCESRGWRSAAASTVLLALCIGLAGCEGIAARFRRQTEPIFTLEIYEIATRGVSDRMTRGLSNYEGSRTVVVRRFPILTSRNITGAEFIENTEQPDAHCLRLTLDHHGTVCWGNASRQLGGDWVAVAVDGFYRFRFRVPRGIESFSQLEIEGAWDAVEGRRVAEEAAANYERVGFRPVMSVW